MKKILVVCMGNICRSPTGEAVLRSRSANQGIEVLIDSAGTIGYHHGDALISERKPLAKLVVTRFRE